MQRSWLAFLGTVACAMTAAQATVPAPATPAAPAPMTLPRVSLVRVYTVDLDKSERFYRTVFGFPAPQAYGERERVFSLPDPTSPKVVLLKVDQPRPNGSFALAIADIDAVLGRVVAAGGKIDRPAQAMGNMPVRIGIITDPDGASIELIQPPASAIKP